MFNSEFYPTPEEIIKKMLEPYNNEKGELDTNKYRYILEPSAGKGDIVKYINEQTKYWYGNKPKIYTLEKDIELADALKGKNSIFLGHDFLNYSDDINFDLIIMNPPFSNGDEHLLKAWEIMQNGDIVCLLNEETIKNPCTKRRQLLNTIIQENGSVEYLGDCFSTADRKTNINVAMVRLTKVGKSRFSFDENTFKKENKVNIDDDFVETAIATKDILKNITIQYKESKELFINILNNVNKIEAFIKSLGGKYSHLNIFDILKSESNNNGIYNNFIGELKKDVWNNIFRKLKVEKYMTSELQREFRNNFVDCQHSIDITEENILELIEFVIMNRGNLLENAIIEVFDLFTKYYKENRCYVEGRKTNDCWKVNRRIILPDVVEWRNRSTGGEFSMNYSREGNRNDIDKALCYIDGKDYEKIQTIRDGLERAFKTGNNIAYSTFFKMRYYKKGTVHLEFRDEWLWKEFNIRATLGKNWLPENEKMQREREKQEKKSREGQLQLG